MNLLCSYLTSQFFSKIRVHYMLPPPMKIYTPFQFCNYRQKTLHLRGQRQFQIIFKDENLAPTKLRSFKIFITTVTSTSLNFQTSSSLQLPQFRFQGAIHTENYFSGPRKLINDFHIIVSDILDRLLIFNLELNRICK